MARKEGYEVIRFIERGEHCHASLDYVEGITLFDWVNTHKEIEKQVLDSWLKELYHQLLLFHSQKGEPEYGKLTPYHIVIMRKNQIALLANKESHKVRSLDKYFLTNKKGQNVDVYCFGKIIQFIMAHTQCEPHLTLWEEFKLQRLVKKCLEPDPKIRQRDIQAVQSYFTENRKWKKKIIVLFGAIFLMIGILGLGKTTIFSKENNENEKSVQTESNMEVLKNQEEETEKDREEDIFSTAGIDYFLELEDYQKSVLCLKHADIQNQKVQFYLKLAEYMSSDKTATDFQMLGSMLEQEDVEEITGEIKELLALLRVYGDNVQREKSFDILNFTEKEEILSQRENLSPKLRMEFEKYRAVAFEGIGKWKEAGEAYSILYKTNHNPEEWKELQKKSFEMNVKYLEGKWNAEFADDEKKIEDVKQLISQNPDIIEYDMFQNFVKERKMHIEQGKIWIEETLPTS